MATIRVRNLNKGTLLADRAAVADTQQARNTGLLKHQRLLPGEGLWIATNLVHTFGMKFAIDVVYLSKGRRVLKVRAAIPKWRISGCLRAHSVLELPAGTAAETATEAGDQLEIEKFP